MPPLSTPSDFVDDVGQPISATAAVDLWRANAIELERRSYRDTPSFEASTAPDPVPPDEHASSNLRIWAGGFLWTPGLGDLVATGTASGWSSGSVITLSVNGVVRSSAFAAATWMVAADLSTGFSDGAGVRVEIAVTNASRWSVFHPTDVYVEYAPVLAAWPGTPTFSGHIFNAAKLNQLSSAQAWLFDRQAAIPFVPRMAQRRRQGTHKTQTYTLEAGSITRRTANQILRIFGEITCNNPQEYLSVEINGSEVMRWPTSGYATQGQTQYPYLPISLAGYPVGVAQQLRIRNVCVTGGQQPGRAGVNSLWSLYYVGTEAPAGGYPVTTPPAPLPGYSTDSSSDIDPDDLQAALNAISAMTQATYDRIAANGHLWSRLRLTRWRYHQDARQNSKLEPVYRHRQARVGDRLVVWGRNVRLCWGAFSIETSDEGKTTTRYQYEETITASDATAVTTIYFDAYPSLFPGTVYWLSGDVYAAQEYLV